MYCMLLLLVVLQTLDASRLDDLQQLQSWLSQHDADISKIRFATIDESNAFIVANTTIYKGDIIMRIPLDLCVSGLSLAGTPLEPLLPKFAIEHPEELAAVAVLYEYSKGNASKYWPYLRALPRPINSTCIAYDAGVISKLPNSKLVLWKILRQQQLRDANFHKIGKAIRAIPMESYAWWTLDDYVWGLAVVHTRSWGSELPLPHTLYHSHGLPTIIRQRVLFPIMDMFNHKFGLHAPKNMVTRDAGPLPVLSAEHPLATFPQFLVLKAKQIWKQEQQIHETYGLHSNLDLFLYFGFTLDRCTPTDQVILVLPPGEILPNSMTSATNGTIAEQLLDYVREAYYDGADGDEDYEVEPKSAEEEDAMMELGVAKLLHTWVYKNMMLQFGPSFSPKLKALGAYRDDIERNWARIRRCQFLAARRTLQNARELCAHRQKQLELIRKKSNNNNKKD